MLLQVARFVILKKIGISSFTCILFSQLLKRVEEIRRGNSQLAEIDGYLTQKSPPQSRFVDAETDACCLIEDFEHVTRKQVRNNMRVKFYIFIERIFLRFSMRPTSTSNLSPRILKRRREIVAQSDCVERRVYTPKHILLKIIMRMFVDTKAETRRFAAFFWTLASFTHSIKSRMLNTYFLRCSKSGDF